MKSRLASYSSRSAIADPSSPVATPPTRFDARSGTGTVRPMALRSIWNGTITFGMVNVPIKLYSATASKTVSFRQVHVTDGCRIEHRRMCPEDEEVVPSDEVVKGYDTGEGRYVILDKEEIKAAAAGDRGKVIHLEEFVDAADIDPVFFEKTYFLGSRDDADAYRLVHAALRASAAPAWLLHLPQPQYLAAVRPGRRGARATRCASTTSSWTCARSRQASRRGRPPRRRSTPGRPARGHARHRLRPAGLRRHHREAVTSSAARPTARPSTPPRPSRRGRATTCSRLRPVLSGRPRHQPRRDKGQGARRGKPPARKPATTSRRRARPCPHPLERLAELRPRQRPGRAAAGHAGPRPALPRTARKDGTRLVRRRFCSCEGHVRCRGGRSATATSSTTAR